LIQDLNTIKHLLNKYIILLLYFSNKDEKKNLVITKIIREVYLINNFKTNMLIKNDLIDLKEITINVISKLIFINNCDDIVFIKVRTSCIVIYTSIHIRKTITIFF